MRKFLFGMLLLVSVIPALAQDDEDCPAQIVFVSSMTRDLDIYIMDLPEEGEIAQEAVRLTTMDGSNAVPRWSPDGTMIAYANEDSDIVIMDALGNLIETFVTEEVSESALSWNPLGTALAFFATADSDLAIGIQMLWLNDEFEPPADMEQRFYRDIDEGRTYLLDWSPQLNGSLGNSDIVLGANWESDGDIFYYSLDTQTRENLTDTPYTEASPAWSPDARLVAYTSYATGAYEIWLLDVATRQAKQLTDFGEFADGASWSPDGNYIVFTGTSILESDNDYDLYVMEADGSNVRQITNFVGHEALPDWRPCPLDSEE